ncbi:MAG: type VI secretion system tip protein TssI/VgrG, partial [Phycisphaerales bacterium]
TEEMGRPVVAHLDLRSETKDIDFKNIIGLNVTVRINPTQEDGAVRYLNGFIADFSQHGVPYEGSMNQYKATMVPWLWFLTRSSDCRIFQNMNIPDIVKQVFDDFGFSDYEFNLTGTYNQREYVVQYRETAFNFVSRLLEEEGIYFFFKHEDGKHTMMIVDAPSAHEAAEGAADVTYKPNDGTSMGFDRVWEWMVEKRYFPGKASLTDFEFKTPSTPLLKDATTVVEFSNIDKFNWYDYPGGYFTAGDGDTLAKIRMEEFEAQHAVSRAKGDVRAIVAGAKFTLKEYPLDAVNIDYVCTAASFSAQGDDFSTGGELEDEDTFEVTFSAIPAATQFRTPRTTPRPRVGGPQTAIVVGTSGEEIYTDEFGRVKVHFHWDRYDKSDENSSCWVRVSHPWAGKKWGFVFLPRIGQEVIVDFLEGDPDRPIITGRVFNQECAVPYTLPDNKTMSTMKSSSSKGGEGFNEIRFEDDAGNEEFFIHAQKDMHVRVLNDKFVTIEHDHHTMVKNDSFTLIENNRHTEVSNDSKEKVGNDLNLDVGGKAAIAIAGSMSLKVDGDVIEVFAGDHSETTSGQLSIKADTIVLEAGTNITFKVGGSTIAIDSSSINIQTTDVTVTADGKIALTASGNGEFKASGSLNCEASGAATFKAGSSATFQGSASATLDGGGSTTVKGGTIAVG